MIGFQVNRRWPAFLLCFTLTACFLGSGCGRRGGANGAGGNVLRYALQNRPTSLDPAMVEDGDTIDMIQQVFEGPVMWNEKNEVVPNLAEKIDISPDGLTYTFHVKPGVKFHNGRELTAADFEYSLTRALLGETKSPTCQTYLYDIIGAEDVFTDKTRKLVGVKVLDDKTFQITIDKRRPYFLMKLTYPTGFVVCREEVEKNDGRVDEKAMIGTGPFKLESYQLGYQVRLAANTDYHRGRPVLDGIIRPIVEDSNTRQTTYESGQLDYVDVQLAELPRIQADATLGRELKQFDRANIWYLALNQQVFAPFKNKKVRQAFAHAIDKDELMRLALRGMAKRAEGIVPPGVPGHDPDFKGLAYDPAKARQLLAEAGYAGGKNFPRLTISFRQGYNYIEDGALAIRNDLKKNLGIDVAVQRVEWAQFLKQRENGTMPCYHLRWAADYLDPQNFLSVMLRTGAKENTIGYSNPEFDRLCDLADVEPDATKRLELYRQAERIAVDDAAWVTIYHKQDVELHKPYVRGIRESTMGHLPHTTTTVER